MQIHEISQPRKSKLNEVDWVGPDSVFSQAKSAWKTGGKSLWDPAVDREAQQARYQDYAAKAIAQGQEKGYLKVPTLADSIAKLKSNPVAQQWINGVVAQWPAVKAQLRKDMAKQGIKEAPEYTTPGGIVVPSGAKTAQAPVAPVATSVDTTEQRKQVYTPVFRNWADTQLRTTNIEQLEASDPDVAKKLKALIDEIVKSHDNEPKQQQLVHDFFSVAVAANHILQAKQRISGKYGLSGVPRPKPNTPSTPIETGLTPIQLQTLGQAAVKAGGTTPTSTGNEFWNAVIEQSLAALNK